MKLVIDYDATFREWLIANLKSIYVALMRPVGGLLSFATKMSVISINAILKLSAFIWNICPSFSKTPIAKPSVSCHMSVCRENFVRRSITFEEFCSVDLFEIVGNHPRCKFKFNHCLEELEFSTLVSHCSDQLFVILVCLVVRHL